MITDNPVVFIPHLTRLILKVEREREDENWPGPSISRPSTSKQSTGRPSTTQQAMNNEDLDEVIYIFYTQLLQLD